jgi:hypothetical protein
MMAEREHTCHHPRCAKVVKPSMLACSPHWFQLPKALRDRVWDEYRVGQEVRRDPSPEYIAAARVCIAFWETAA